MNEGDELIFVGDIGEYRDEFKNKMPGVWIFVDYVEYDMVTAFAIIKKKGEDFSLNLDYNDFTKDFERPHKIRKDKIDRLVD